MGDDAIGGDGHGGGTDRALAIATSLMRMALALLDRAGRTDGAARLQAALDLVDAKGTGEGSGFEAHRKASVDNDRSIV